MLAGPGSAFSLPWYALSAAQLTGGSGRASVPSYSASSLGGGGGGGGGAAEREAAKETEA